MFISYFVPQTENGYTFNDSLITASKLDTVSVLKRDNIFGFYYGDQSGTILGEITAHGRVGKV